MKVDNEIVSKCLYGFIQNETLEEQKRCLNAIKVNYGKIIAGIVENFLHK